MRSIQCVAVRTAADLARGEGGFVTLLHVVETLDLPYEEVAEFYDRLEARAGERQRHADKEDPLPAKRAQQEQYE